MELNEYEFSEIRKEYLKRLKEMRPAKQKPLTCRNCKFRKSTTDIRKIYHEPHRGMLYGSYCLNKIGDKLFTKIDSTDGLFHGLKQIACDKFELKTK